MCLLSNSLSLLVVSLNPVSLLCSLGWVNGLCPHPPKGTQTGLPIDAASEPERAGSFIVDTSTKLPLEWELEKVHVFSAILGIIYLYIIFSDVAGGKKVLELLFAFIRWNLFSYVYWPFAFLPLWIAYSNLLQIFFPWEGRGMHSGRVLISRTRLDKICLCEGHICRQNERARKFLLLHNVSRIFIYLFIFNMWIISITAVEIISAKKLICLLPALSLR